MTMPAYNQRFTLLKQALAYAEKGWPVLPLYPVKDGVCTCKAGAECQSAGKHPWVKWKGGGSTDPVQIKSWWHERPASNIGIETGRRSGILLLDCDGEAGMASIRSKDLPRTPTSTTGKGKHYLFQHPDITLKTKNKVGILPGLDIRTDGGLFVAPPSQHYSGRVYTWEVAPENAAVAPAPAWLVELFKEDEPIPFPVRNGHANGATAYGQSALERETIDIRNALPGTRNNTLNKAAYSLGQLVAGGVLDRFDVERELETAGAGVGLPYHEVRSTIESGIAGGMENPRGVPVREERPSGIDAFDREVANCQAQKEEGIIRPKRLWHAFELGDFPPPSWLVDGELIRNSLAFIFGESGCGKSFIALDYALRVAEAENVVYMAGEGVSGYHKRIQAWLKTHKQEQTNFYFWPDPVQLVDPPATAGFLVEVAPLKPALIVIDTLARTAVGLDENSAKDMGEYVAAADWIRRKTGACVLIIHHTGKNGATERGSSALRGAADTVIKISVEDMQRKVACEKMKDALEFEDIWIELRPCHDSLVALRTDRDASVIGQGLSRAQKTILETLCMETFVETGATANRLTDITGLKSSTLFKALSRLKALDMVRQGQRGDPFFITSKGEFSLEIER